MSIYYNIQEHLVIDQINNDSESSAKEDILFAMSNRLACLGALMLQNGASVCEIRLDAGDNTYRFSGSCPDSDLKTLIGALTEAKNADLVLKYNYEEFVNDEISEAAAPFAFADMINGMNENERKGIFYSMWNCADFVGGEGVLCAYGERDGKQYDGAVEPETVSGFSEGDWYADTDFVVELEGHTKEDHEKAVLLCKELSSAVDSEYDADSIETYFMNEVHIKTKADFEKLTSAYKELVRLGFEVNSIGEYHDSSLPDVRLMSITYDGHNNPVVKIAQIG